MHPRVRKPRTHRCGRRVHTAAPRPLLRNWREFIGNRTDYLFVTVFFTTTSRHGAEKTLLHARLRVRPRGSRETSMTSLSSGIWRAREIGVAPMITSKRCG